MYISHSPHLCHALGLVTIDAASAATFKPWIYNYFVEHNFIYAADNSLLGFLVSGHSNVQPITKPNL